MREDKMVSLERQYRQFGPKNHHAPAV